MWPWIDDDCGGFGSDRRMCVQWSMVDSGSRTNVGKGAFNNHPTGKFYTTYICVLMGWIWAKYYFSPTYIDFPDIAGEFLLNDRLGAQNSCEVAIIWPTLFWMISLFLPTWFVVSKCFFNKVCVYLSCAHTKPKSLQGGEAYVITKNCTTSRNFYATDLENLELNDS